MYATSFLTVSIVAWLALAAQPAPDFSGRWTVEADAQADAAAARGRAGTARGDMGTGWGSTITIAQTTTRLVVEYAFFGRGDMQPPLRFTYLLDGSESRNSVMMGRGIEEQISRTVWENRTLVITTAYAFPDPAGKPLKVDVTRRLTLDSPASLVVEVTRAGVLGGPSSTTRTTYKKAGT